MAKVTTNRNDPDITYGIDDKPTEQAKAYIVLDDEELKRGFIRPYRAEYRHLKCDSVTRMSLKLSETYARDPKFYSATYCVKCKMHRPVSEFVWMDGDIVGS